MGIKTVVAEEVSGFNMSIAQFFGSGPKMTITCGNCYFMFKTRVMVVNHPRVLCPACSAINILPLELK